MLKKQLFFIISLCLFSHGMHAASAPKKRSSIAQFNLDTLFSAIRAGNLEAVKTKIADQNIKDMINDADKSGYTPLDVAMVMFHTDDPQTYGPIVKELLVAGEANMPVKSSIFWLASDTKDILKEEEARRAKMAAQSQSRSKSRPKARSSNTPEKALNRAALNGDAEEVEKILNNGKVNVNTTSDEYFVAPLAAAWSGHRNDIGHAKADQYTKIFKLLLDAGADTDQFQKQTTKGALALGTIKTLVQEAASAPKKRSSIAQFNLDTLFSAIRAGNLEAVKTKIADKNIKDMINDADENDYTPLEIAIIMFNKNPQKYGPIMKELLVTGGANMPVKGAMSWNIPGVKDILKEEEARRAKMAAQSQSRSKSRPKARSSNTPEKALNRAALNGDAEEVEKILNNGKVNVNTTSDEYFVAPLAAAWSGHRNDIGHAKADQYTKIFKLLLDAGADTDQFKKQTTKGALALDTIKTLVKEYESAG